MASGHNQPRLCENSFKHEIQESSHHCPGQEKRIQSDLRGRFFVYLIATCVFTQPQPEVVACGNASEDCSWPEARDRRGSSKLSITGSSKPASDCFRGLDRNGALGQELSSSESSRTAGLGWCRHSRQHYPQKAYAEACRTHESLCRTLHQGTPKLRICW